MPLLSLRMSSYEFLQEGQQRWLPPAEAGAKQSQRCSRCLGATPHSLDLSLGGLAVSLRERLFHALGAVGLGGAPLHGKPPQRRRRSCRQRGSSGSPRCACRGMRGPDRGVSSWRRSFSRFLGPPPCRPHSQHPPPVPSFTSLIVAVPGRVINRGCQQKAPRVFIGLASLFSDTG